MTYYFTRDHEWISVNATIEDAVATVGITDYAQAQLGDIVFVEVPPVGTIVEKGKEAAVVESVKAASDVYAPVSGEVVEANRALEGEPALVNTAPETDGWFFRLRLTNIAELHGLMDGEAYKTYVAGL
ncbi:glycine cleavage system protein GcvH [Sphingomonas quercus]|uniref:Glycine cleavage system H protein n=1 Tax=Sphingomonas quercus TaxID=2842451 RepID=A0ABS6BPA8_9SPHN|nr:glycine cleavage system protein GcvH [Sphingomonas quercus]